MTQSETLALPAPPAVPVSSRRAGRHDARAAGPGDALIAAQAHVHRGLKAGRSALVDAKSAYGEAQWSGGHDRRPEPGLLVRARL